MNATTAEFFAWLRSHRGAVTMAGVLSFAAPVRFFVGAITVMREPPLSDVLALAGWFVLFGIVLWVLLLVIGFALQRARFMRLHPRIAMLLGACLASVIANVANGRGSILVEQGIAQSAQSLHSYAFAFVLIMALLFFAHLQRSSAAEEAAARLATAQAAQHEARRRLGQARLQAMQARIDPQLLFDMLDAVRRAYQIDAAHAERLLDELASFLRLALVRLRSKSSSVVHEVQLVSAYTRLRMLAGAASFDVRLEIPEDVAAARFPPGVLVPLLEQAVGVGAGSCALVASRSATECMLVLTLPARPLDAVVAHVRSLLSDLYGASADLSVACAKGVINATIKVPYELA